MKDQVFTFWYEGDLGDLQHACIASWLRVGHQVTLLSYGQVGNVPQGVLQRDASEFLSRDIQAKLVSLRFPDRHFQPIVSMSDLLRMKAMQSGLGLWLDADVYLFKKVDYRTDRLHLAWEERSFVNGNKVGVSILYIPKEHDILFAYLDVFNQPNLMPDWIGFRRLYLKSLKWRLIRAPFNAVDLSITAYGNLAIRSLVKRHNCSAEILDKTLYYHWIGHETNRFFTDPKGRAELQAAGAVGIHVHRKNLAGAEPKPGTLYDEALRLAKQDRSNGI